MKPFSCQRQTASVVALVTAAAVITAMISFDFKIPRNRNFADENIYRYILGESIPTFHSISFDYGEFFGKLISDINISSPKSLIYGNILSFAAANEAKPQKAEPIESETPTPDAKPIEEISISAGGSGYLEAYGVKVKNATSYEIDAVKLIDEPLSFSFDKAGPKVLIVHSHSSESYTATDKNYYLPTDPDRTEDINYNVVRVGTEIEKTLKKLNIEVVHDTSLHDYPSYNGSYKSSLASVEAYLEKYPSIKIVLDIHRDAMVRADGTKLKLCADVNGKKAAQIMLLTGSNEGGLEHPDWRENLKFAMKLQKVINNMYPGLARPVSFTKERYNTHTTRGSLIIEVGTTGNTLEEALVSAEMVGESVAEFINSCR